MAQPETTTLAQCGTARKLKVAFSRSMIRQGLRFCVVGTINTVLDLAVLNLLILVTGTGHSGTLFTFFKTVSFFAALGNSYLMNAKWTFGGPGVSTSAVQGAQFVFVSILGSVLNIGAASYVATYVHPPMELHAYWPSVAALVGTLFSFLFNFVGYKYFVFTNRDRSPIETAPATDQAAPRQFSA